MRGSGKSWNRGRKVALGAALLCLALAPQAPAAPPTHPRTPALDLSGLSKACGAAVDSEGNLYAASPGEGKIKVFGPADHETPLAEIADAHEPCGLAVDSHGDLFVLQGETGEVVRYVPEEFPFEGAPSYGEAEIVDSSGEARGIAVDAGELWANSNRALGSDDTLFVSEGDRVETYANEVQEVNVSGSSGTYELCFAGECTTPIPYNASHEEVREALEALSAIGAGDVAVTTANFGATDHRVTFTHRLGLADVERIEVDTSELSGSVQTALLTQGGLGTDEEQLIRLTGVSGGSFSLTFDGQSTEPPIKWDASAGEVEVALEGLSNLEAGDVTVRIQPSGSARILSVAFGGAYAATDVPQLETASALEPNEVQRVTVKATAGTYKLSFEGQSTGPIPYNASHEEMQEALEALSAIGKGNVAVTGGPGDEEGTSPYEVTFEGALAGTNVAKMSRDISTLAGTASVATIVNGPTLKAETIAQGWSGRIGEGTLTEAVGLAAYTHAIGEAGKSDRYLFVADAASDRIEVFAATEFSRATKPVDLVPRPPIEGPATGEGFEFGPAGTHLAADPGNALEEKTLKCAEPVDEQACTAGHLILYDAAREEVEEFDASGRFLDSFGAAGLADAEPSALAIDRSGGATDGTIYAGSGAGAGASLLAFGPLSPPSREALPKLSQTLAGAETVATDSFGNVYAAAGSTVHVYGTDGVEIGVGPEGKGFGLEAPSSFGIEVDSAGRVYVFGKVGEWKVGYHTPSAFPPKAGTTYSSEPTIVATEAGLGFQPRAIGLDPENDHLFVGGSGKVVELGSAGEGSPLIDECFACGLVDVPKDIAVGLDHVLNATVELGKGRPGVIDPEGGEVWARASGAGGPLGLDLFDTALATDLANGHILAFNPSRETVEEYDASGAFVAAFGSFTSLNKAEGIAVDNACELHEPPLTGKACEEFDPANGSVYVAFDDTAPETYDVTAFGPLEYGPPPSVTIDSVDGLGGGKASLHGSVNPNGVPVEECNFEYLSDTEYEENGKTFAGATSVPCSPGVAELGKGTGSVPVQAEIDGLDPAERYRFGLVAKNKYGEGRDEKGLFGPPLTEAKSALPVAYSEATLRGKVDPSGLATTYHFEYLTQAEYEASGESFASAKSTSTLVLSGSEGFVAVQAPLTGLAEGTAYRFRLLAENGAGKAQAEGPAFATLELPPTPPCPNSAYRTGLSARLPDCRVYELLTPAETHGAQPYSGRYGSAGEGFNEWLSPPRGAGEGERLTYFVDGTLPGFEGNGRFDGYRAQRGEGEHPADGWTNALIGPSFLLAGDELSTQLGVSSDQEFSLWKTGSNIGLAGALERGTYLRTSVGFEPLGRGSIGEDLGAEGRFLASGGAHAIFTSTAHLEPGAAPAGTTAIYDRAAGAASAAVVSVKPGGGAFGSGEGAAYLGASEDGGAVVFRVGGTLYLHDAGGAVEVAKAPNSFAGLAADGSRLLYAREGDLFSYDAASEESTEIAEGASFVSASPDAGAALLSSEAALTPPEEENEAGQHAEAGALNLYRWDGTGLEFVSPLDPADLVSFGGDGKVNIANWSQNLSGGGAAFGRDNSPTRSTPDGGVFVFQSHARLTAYDNEGVGEIYRFAPAAPAGERMLCVSCDPTGAPPGADAMLQIFEEGTGEKKTTPTGPRVQIPNLTDDGNRVLFHSAEQLLPEDANSATDIYEWTAPGAGGCGRPGGCLALISSGQSDAESYLYAMSADGHDVFFATTEKLVGFDVPGSASIYDAREEGGIPEAPPAEVCEGDACQGPPTQPPVLSAPETGGAGEASPPNSSAHRGCGKGRRLVKGRCVKKVKHRRRHRHRRKGHHRRRHSGRAVR